MKILNTLSRTKEEFVPLGDTVRMYVCGVTPYSESHVGHAMSYITFDVIRRFLEWRGYEVLHIQNFTDVDDKIIQRAAATGAAPQALVEGLIQEYFKEMDALNVLRAHRYPRVTEEIPEIIEMVKGLVDKGYAYSVDGDVYYRVNNYADYGKLSHRTLEGMMSGVRVEIDQRKEHPMDFALWKSAKPDEPSWESPWGPGRPGWHMECSAMSLKYLGETLDIHGGGFDLVFPHHENEIAQTEAYTGVIPSVRYWIHNGLLQLGEEKMSKSLGNLVTVKEALASYSPDALRLFFLSSHYRSPLTYSDEAIKSMERGAARLRNAVESPSQSGDTDSEVSPDIYSKQFIEAMEDDFNTPQAIAALHDLAREINRGKHNGAGTLRAVETLKELAGVLGLTLKESLAEAPLDSSALRELVQSIARDIQSSGLDALAESLGGIHLADEAGPDAYIEALISVRGELRKTREWGLADSIRGGLAELGIALEDTPQGSLWKRS